MLSSIPQNTTFMTTQGTTMKKLSHLRKYWISFTYQLMGITLIWQYLMITIFKFHLRWPPNSFFVNNNFKIGFSAWQANIYIQPVFNEHKAITYKCAYLSNSEESCSYEMKQALKFFIEIKKIVMNKWRP